MENFEKSEAGRCESRNRITYKLKYFVSKVKGWEPLSDHYNP